MHPNVVRRADGAEARAATGFAIGGVPPFGHATALTVPDAVFAVTPDDLVRACGGRTVELAEEPAR